MNVVIDRGRSSGLLAVLNLPISTKARQWLWRMNRSIAVGSLWFVVLKFKIDKQFQKPWTGNWRQATDKELTATGIAPDLHRTSLLIIRINEW